MSNEVVPTWETHQALVKRVRDLEQFVLALSARVSELESPEKEPTE